MLRRTTLALVFLVMVSLLGMVTSCQTTAGTNDNNNDDTGDNNSTTQPNAADRLIALHATNSSPIMAALATSLGSVSGDDFVLDDYEGVRDAVGDATAVAVDATQLDPNATTEDPLIQAALDTGTPIVFLNSEAGAAARQGTTDDATNAISNAVGAAVPARAMVVTAARSAIRQAATTDPDDFYITTYGEPLDLEAPANDTDDRIDLDPPADVDPSELSATDVAPEEYPDAASTQPDPMTDAEIAQAIADELTGTDAAARQASYADYLMAEPPSDSGIAIKTYTFTSVLGTTQYLTSGGTWNPGGGAQTATVAMAWRVVLYKDALDKYVRVMTLGSGFSIGTATWDDWTNRGYFQDLCRVGVSLTSPTSGFSVLAFSPQTENSSNQVSSSTSINFSGSAGADSDGPTGTVGAGYSSSASATETITDFKVTRTGSGTYQQWDHQPRYGHGFGITTGQAVNSWGDWISPWTGAVLIPPDLAKTGMAPRCQVVYQCSANYTGNAYFNLSLLQRAQHVWVGWYLFWVEAHSQAYQSSWSQYPVINMGAI